ncbi:MAG: acyl-CoA/acyl-ACP dehydrogenase [Salinibacterium sp.]|nr:acyl-CoA/acyl-ACP dehydrogenase [Salinibacterium sp.]
MRMPTTIVSTPDARPLAERVAYVADIAGRYAGEVDAAARFPAEAVDAMRSTGLLGASLPTSLGGEGLTLSELGSIAAKIGAACSSAGMVFAMHHSQVLSMSRHLGGSASLAVLAGRIATEQLLIASATTELGIGGDVRSSSCFVDIEGDKVRLVKNAPVISYGSEADLVFVTARRNADSAPSDQVVVVCDAANLQLEPTGGWDTLGLRGTASMGYRLNALVAADRVIPEPYESISTESMLPVCHVLWASVWLGMARALVDICRQYVRAAARRSIGSVPPGATKLVDLIAELERFEALVDGLARRTDEIFDDREALGTIGYQVSINNLKVTASELVAQVAIAALAITGISGYRNDGQYSVARIFRDAQGAALMVHNDRIIANTARLILVQKG